jgi:uncharacterized protein (DUF342 family)
MGLFDKNKISLSDLTFNVGLSHGKTIGKIRNFPIKQVNSERIEVTDTWLEKVIRNKKIVNGVDEKLIQAIVACIEKGDDPEGMTFAHSDRGESGKNPFLVRIYHDRAAEDDEHEDEHEDHSQADEENEEIDYDPSVDPSQKFVRKGEPIARIEFEIPPVLGMDVFGQPTEPEFPSIDSISTDPTVRLSEETHIIYANISGKIGFKKHSLYVESIDVHEGDVDSTFGDIEIFGSLEITGSIRPGITVKVEGDLIVRGNARGASLTVGGNLVVLRGIKMGLDAKLEVDGEVALGFIRDSNLVCGQNITIQIAAISSFVQAKGNIISSGPATQFYGGHFVCGGIMEVANLGRDGAEKTAVDVGVDWERYLKIRAMKAEMEALQESADGKDAANALKHEIALLSHEFEYNTKATVSVKGALSPNIHLTIAGKTIGVPEEYNNVSVSSKLNKGTFFTGNN